MSHPYSIDTSRKGKQPSCARYYERSAPPPTPFVAAPNTGMSSTYQSAPGVHYLLDHPAQYSYTSRSRLDPAQPYNSYHLGSEGQFYGPWPPALSRLNRTHRSQPRDVMSIAPGPSNHWTQQRQSAYQQDQLGSQEACQHDAAHANQLLEMRRHLVSLHADSAAHHAQPPTNEPTPENQSQTMTLKYSYPDASASPSTDPYAPANQASVTSDLETSSAHTIGQREDERSSDVSEPPPEALRLIVDMRDMRNEIEGIAYDVAGLREEVRKVLGLVGGVAGE